ncbi:MAG TPA: lipoyl(octanoyl) transferase LipB [Planctomycetota bacterium]|nr:lipoyl(octanoyl) transferase LipB [Planctomycetota bacterium]
MDAPLPAPVHEHSKATLAVRDLGRLAYREAWELQKRLVAERLAGRAPDTLLVVEHEPVITVGRGTKGGFLAGDTGPGREPGGPEIVAVERGGQATWHGPGQIVVYPIVKLADGHRDLHGFMRALEEAVIRTLAEFGLQAGRREGATGVWIDGRRKLCSIGVAASRWVTYHGLALNHEPDLSAFAAINPCGFDAAVMTSVRRELGENTPSREELVKELVALLQPALLPVRETAGN